MFENKKKFALWMYPETYEKIEALYAKQSGEIENRITELRIERRKKLSEDENDELLYELKTLKATPHNSDGVVAPSDFSSNDTNRRRLY